MWYKFGRLTCRYSIIVGASSTRSNNGKHGSLPGFFTDLQHSSSDRSNILHMDTSHGLDRNIDNNIDNGNIRIGNRQHFCSCQQQLRCRYGKDPCSYCFYRHTSHTGNNHGKHIGVSGLIADLQHHGSHRSNLLHMDTGNRVDRHINYQLDNGNYRSNKR